MEKKIRRFCKRFRRESENIAAISAKDVRDYIMEVGKSDSNRKAIKRNLSPLFSWAVANEHMASTPCAGMTAGRRTGVNVREAIYPDGEIVRVIRFKVEDLRRADFGKRRFCHSAGKDEAKRRRFQQRYGAY